MGLSPAEMEAAILKNIHERTGKSLAEVDATIRAIGASITHAVHLDQSTMSDPIRELLHAAYEGGR